MPEFEVECSITITLTGSVTVRARNEDAANDKVDKLLEGLALAAFTIKGSDIEWEEESFKPEVTSISEV